MKSFFQKIKEFNRTYNMPTVTPETSLKRLSDFQSILYEEVDEGNLIYEDFTKGKVPYDTVRVAMADWLGDVMVYCASEAERWNIPIEDVLQIIMASNASKLGADGKPIYDERGKLLKGPNYWKPEPKIKELLEG